MIVAKPTIFSLLTQKIVMANHTSGWCHFFVCDVYTAKKKKHLREKSYTANKPLTRGKYRAAEHIIRETHLQCQFFWFCFQMGLQNIRQ